MKSFWLLSSPFLLFKEHSTCSCNERSLGLLKNKDFYHPCSCALDAILADAAGPVFQQCRCVRCGERRWCQNHKGNSLKELLWPDVSISVPWDIITELLQHCQECGHLGGVEHVPWDQQWQNPVTHTGRQDVCVNVCARTHVHTEAITEICLLWVDLRIF